MQHETWYQSKKFIAMLIAAVPSFVLIAIALLKETDSATVNTLITVLGGGSMLAVSSLIGVQGVHDIRVHHAQVVAGAAAEVAKDLVK